MIRIFVDGHIFDQEYQGSRSFVHGLYTHLSHLDDLAIDIGACDVERLARLFPVRGNVSFVRYPSRNRIIRYGWVIPRLLRARHYDFAHFQYLAPVDRPCPYIVTIHDVLFNDFPREFPFGYGLVRNITFKPAASRAAILTTDSEYSRQAIARHYNIRMDRIAVVPVGVDDGFFEPYDRSAAAAATAAAYGVSGHILCISRFEPRKNQDLLLRTYNDLKLWQRGLSLVFVGKRSLPYPAFDMRLAQAPAAARPHIRHFEQVPQQDLMRLLQSAILFVYPSKCEGFGLPPLEAGALGIPVLCSNTTAMADYRFFGDGHFDPNNAAGFGRLLERTIGKLQQGGRSGTVASVIKQCYGWQGIAQRFHKLLDPVA